MLQIHTEKFQLAGMFRKFLSPFFQTNQMLDILQRDFPSAQARRPSLYFLHHEWRLCQIYKSSPVDDRTTICPFQTWEFLLRIRPVADQNFIRIDMSSFLPVIIQRDNLYSSLTALKSTSIPPCCVPIPVAAGYPEAHSEEA